MFLSKMTHVIQDVSSFVTKFSLALFNHKSKSLFFFLRVKVLSQIYLLCHSNISVSLFFFSICSLRSELRYYQEKAQSHNIMALFLLT